MARTQAFGEMLTRGVQRIKSCEANKPVSVIHDELGYAIGREGGSAISYWRQGHIPKPDDLENLAREIVKRSDLDLSWLKQFLASAEYPYPFTLCNELFPENGEDKAAAQINRLLPWKSYRRLIGRDLLLTELVTKLNEPYGFPVIAVDGMGGIGKTALVHAVAATCLRRHYFESVVWLSSDSGALRPWYQDSLQSNIQKQILLEIGTQLAIDLPGNIDVGELKERVRERLCQNPVLIVLDNLESFSGHQEEIVQLLRALLGLSKALLTSRVRFVGDLYVVHLGGLEGEDAEEFVRTEAKDRRLYHVEQAGNDEIARITAASGGSPLAMKLVVGQLGHLPIQTVLSHLQEVKSISDNKAIDEYVNLYRTIYLPTWRLLSGEAENLLISMAEIETKHGVEMQSIQQVTKLTYDRLVACINELWRLSLLEVVEPASSGLDELRYSLHELTQRFVLSDIVKSDLLV